MINYFTYHIITSTFIPFSLINLFSSFNFSGVPVSFKVKVCKFSSTGFSEKEKSVFLCLFIGSKFSISLFTLVNVFIFSSSLLND
ncbi:MAG: hypothetical protein [Caudoviricetes sp.]|nr:MAG: hypothetical protein [Caudoviricetes sp.]